MQLNFVFIKISQRFMIRLNLIFKLLLWVIKLIWTGSSRRIARLRELKGKRTTFTNSKNAKLNSNAEIETTTMKIDRTNSKKGLTADSPTHPRKSFKKARLKGRKHLKSHPPPTNPNLKLKIDCSLSTLTLKATLYSWLALLQTSPSTIFT